MPYRSGLFYLLIPVLFPYWLHAGEHLTIDDDKEVFSIQENAAYFFPGEEFDAAFLSANFQYDLFEDHFTKGKPETYKDQNIVAVQFSIKRETDNKLYLRLPDLDLQELKLYVVRDNKANLIYQTGLQYNNRTETLRHNKYFLELKSASTHPKTYILFIKDKHMPAALNLDVSTVRTFIERSPGIILVQGMFYGALLLLFLYCLFQYFAIRDISFVFFGLYALTVGLFFAIYKGLVIEYVLGEISHDNKYEELLTCIAGILTILLASQFLKTVVNAPRRHLWMLSLNVFFIGAAILFLFQADEVAIQILQYNIVFTIVFILITSYSNLRSGFSPASYFFWGWLIMLANLVFEYFHKDGYFSHNLLTDNLLQIGTMVHILLLSFALAKKMRIIIDKKNEAQEIALTTAIENEKLITHQKQLLETKVFERTKDLEQSIATLQKQEDALKDASRFKDKVFSIISHDLKSPLSTLTGLVELVRMNSLSEEEKQRILGNIDLALKNTRNLLDNILAWANPKMKNQDQKTEVDAYAAINEIFQLFKMQAENKNIDLFNNIEIAKQIYTERNTYYLVMRNLISNAIKFTPNGGEITVSLQEIGNDAIVSVADSGMGIDEQTRKKIFENHDHYSTRGTENEKGTGLGLMLCKDFLEKNNGSIWAESMSHKGSTFYVRLQNAVIQDPTMAIG